MATKEKEDRFGIPPANGNEQQRTSFSRDVQDHLDDLGAGKAWLDLFGDLADNTGMHGLPNIKRHGNWCKKIFWILILLTSLGFGIWQISLCILKLLALPTETSVKEEPGKREVFPAVTFCNVNPVLRSAAEGMSIFNTYTQTTPAPSRASTTPPSWDYSYDASNYGEDQSFELSTDFLYTYSSLNSSQRISMGYPLTGMLMSCTFLGASCTARNFSVFSNAVYGNCYTFNNGYNSTELKRVSRTGPRHALELALFIDQSEYMAKISKSAGIRVVLHQADHQPFPEDEGFSVRPGTETFVAMHAEKHELTYPPYGPCVDMTPDQNLKLNAWAKNDALRPRAYTAKACKYTCQQKEIIKNCGCYDPQYPGNGAAFESLDVGNYSTCDQINNTVEICVQEVYDNYSIGVLDCDTPCPPACHYTKYKKELTQTLWPSEAAEQDVLNELTFLSQEVYNVLNGMSSQTEQTSYLKKNVLKLRIFFSTLDKTIIKTEPSYLVFQFLSDLGGQTGLWLGFSAITFFEFIELFWDVIYLIIVTGKAAGDKSTRVQSITNVT